MFLQAPSRSEHSSPSQKVPEAHSADRSLKPQSLPAHWRPLAALSFFLPSFASPSIPFHSRPTPPLRVPPPATRTPLCRLSVARARVAHPPETADRSLHRLLTPPSSHECLSRPSAPPPSLAPAR